MNSIRHYTIENLIFAHGDVLLSQQETIKLLLKKAVS